MPDRKKNCRLTGGSPFHGKSYNEILIKNKNCDIRFNFKEGGHQISPAGTSNTLHYSRNLFSF